MAFRLIPLLTAEGEEIFTSDGEQVFTSTLEEYAAVVESQWRLYRFDLKSREEEES